MSKNFYELLEISNSANKNEINNAYKKQLKRFQKKLNKGDKSFKLQIEALKKAFNVLNDKNKRLIYDEGLGSSDFSSNINKSGNNVESIGGKPNKDVKNFRNKKKTKVAKKRNTDSSDLSFKVLDLESRVTLIFITLAFVLFFVVRFF